MPTSEVCEMLIRAYFHHVHPFFPIVEARSFIETFESSLRDELSIHLLWSMFLAAANVCVLPMCSSEINNNTIKFADDVTLRAANVSSRKEMKRFMYTRAKLWWSCFYRETWFSAGMGRPMRTRLADCNTPMPDAIETEEQLAGLAVSLREKYLPNSLGELTKLWTQLLNLTVTLSNILLQQQRAARLLPSRTEIEHTESHIRACYRQYDDNRVRNENQIVSLYAYHLELYVE
ncbi:hypothetical protein N0V90_005947 [Kalmusia sp. IMI 367209]|nr:hypothetical protein N0V90_005947 [Kalmusia sp. IMI 367209]